MKFLVIVKVHLSVPFDFWKSRFDAHREARRAAGIHDVLCHPVIGEQAAVYAVQTETPRAVHEMIYDPASRPGIEASGFIIGREEITVCEVSDLRAPNA